MVTRERSQAATRHLQDLAWRRQQERIAASKQTKPEEIVGEWKETRFRAPDNSYVIGFLADGTCVKGAADAGDFVPGCVYRYFGKWGQDNFGKHFRFVAFSKEAALTRQAVVAYLLRELKDYPCGIGEKTAHRIYDIFQSDSVRVLRTKPKEIAEEFGLDPEKVIEAARHLESIAKTETTRVELIGLLAGKGFRKDGIDECIKRWGAKAPVIIKTDAFRLLTAKIPGAGFATVDNIYLSLGGNPGKIKRQIFLMIDAIRHNRGGHSWIKFSEIRSILRDKICGAPANEQRAFRVAKRCRMVQSAIPFDGDIPYSAHITDQKHCEAERIIASRIIATGKTAWPSPANLDISPSQIAALEVATSARIGILAGTPGTGKTFTAAALITAILKKHDVGSIAACAPTGKAAVRLTETFRRYEIPIVARTIHSLLGGSRSVEGDLSWEFSARDCGLEETFFIVDESSMIDTELFASFLSATKSGAHILFLGDPYQLAPVGRGAPLRDMIDSQKVPVGLLTKVERNIGGIVIGCEKIREGLSPIFSKKFGTAEENLMIAEYDGSAAAIRILKQAIVAISRSGADIINDVQILVPRNDGEIGRKELNRILQELCNPTEEDSNSKYRVRDKIICLSNGAYTEQNDDGIFGAVRIANGEQGFILSIDNSGFIASFPDGTERGRIVVIKRGTKDWDKFDLAYAITVHKSQGSEWPIVIILGDDSAGMVASREWWYTAISRGARRCLVICKRATLGKQIQRVTLRDRVTRLKEAIIRAGEKE